MAVGGEKLGINDHMSSATGKDIGKEAGKEFSSSKAVRVKRETCGSTRRQRTCITSRGVYAARMTALAA